MEVKGRLGAISSLSLGNLTQVVSPGRGRKCSYLLNHPMAGLELLTKINALSLLSQVLGLVSKVLWSSIDFS